MTERPGRSDRQGTLDLSRIGAPTALSGLITKAVRSALPLLIEGETGTGKTHLARLIHDLGPRTGTPFIAQNCAALSEGLFEAELFGHTRGAFTGAVQARHGLIEAAHTGTLVLDEIAELQRPQQSALLQVLDHGEFRPVGSNRLARAAFRLISVTHLHLAARVRSGEFRHDLFRRCAVLYLCLPPLRERRVEIPSLVAQLLESIVKEQGATRMGEEFRRPEVSPTALRLLCEHPWPGNLRDLEHALRDAVMQCEGDRIEPEHLRDMLAHLEQLADLVVTTSGGTQFTAGVPLTRASEAQADGKHKTSRKRRYVPPEDQAVERANIDAALEKAQGNKSEAARILGITRQGLDARMLRLGMKSRNDVGDARRK